MKNLVFLVLPLLVLAGCGKTEVAFVPASGVLNDVEGKPMPDIKVTFMPDVREGNAGPSSTAITDGEGKFSLRSIDNKREGAVPGKHRVTLIDMKEERPAQGEEAVETSRIPSVLTTEDGALLVEVTEGKEIQLVAEVRKD